MSTDGIISIGDDGSPMVTAPGGQRSSASTVHVPQGKGVHQTEAGSFLVDVPYPAPEGSQAILSDVSETVVIPGGHRARSLVHLIRNGTYIDCNDNMLRHLDEERSVIKEIGQVQSRPRDRPLMPQNVQTARSFAPTATKNTKPATFGTGWITNTGWTNTTGTPISSFSTTWEVPPAPISHEIPSNDNHVIFTFNGIQNSTFIYQPVLQWGYSGHPGTGPYWVVACWYVDGQGGPAFHSDFVRVNPGDYVTGVMTLTGGANGKYNYNSEFVGIPNTSFPITNAEELTWCNETLEAYGILGASSYPPTFRTVMRNINIRTGNVNPSLTWSVQNRITDCGQHTVVVQDGSINGEINLCYGTVALPSTTALSWGPNRIDIFGLGYNNDLAHKYRADWAQAWGNRGWEILGGFLNSAPVAATWSHDRLDIFGLGKDNQMYHKAWDGGNWRPSFTGWEALGGGFTSPPAVCSWASNRLDIFAIGNDRQMFHKAWNGSWHPSATEWEGLGGIFNSPPAVVSWGPNRLDIFGLGTDNSMYHKVWDGSWRPSATDWESLGGIFNSPPTVVSWGPNRLDIFGLGTDNACYHKFWTGNAWGPSTRGWENLGGVFNSSVQAVCWQPNRIDLFGLGLDKCCYHMAWDGAAWRGWERVSSNTFNSAPSVTSWGPNRLDVFALGPRNQMMTRAWTGSAWDPPAQDWLDLGGIFDPE